MLVIDVYNVIAGAALIASGSTYVAAIIPVCVVAIYYIQKFYLRTSRQMRHLDLEAKSPLYRLFTEAAAGIITVRHLGGRRTWPTRTCGSWSILKSRITPCEY